MIIQDTTVIAAGHILSIPRASKNLSEIILLFDANVDFFQFRGATNGARHTRVHASHACLIPLLALGKDMTNRVIEIGNLPVVYVSALSQARQNALS